LAAFTGGQSKLPSIVLPIAFLFVIPEGNLLLAQPMLSIVGICS
jgi:hypothetical protein